MVEEEGGSVPEKQILVGGGSKPVDGGEAEKKDRIRRAREAAIRNIVYSFKPEVVAIEQAKVIETYNMNSPLCKCRVTTCVPYSGSGPDQVFKATIEGCALHQVEPKVMFRQRGSLARRFREVVARRKKMRLEMEREIEEESKKMRLEMEREIEEESIRSKKIRCCSTSLLGETS